MKIISLMLSLLLTNSVSASMTVSVAVDSSINQIDLYGQLDDTCDGLAYYSLNLTLTGPDEVTLGDILTLTRPDAMSSFDNPLGLSNTPGTSGQAALGGQAFVRV